MQEHTNPQEKLQQFIHQLRAKAENLFSTQGGGNPVLTFLKKISDVEPLVAALSSGRTIKATLRFIWNVNTVALAVGLLGGWVGFLGSWFVAFNRMHYGGILRNPLAFLFLLIGVAIWQIAFLYAGFLATMIMFFRGRSLKELPESDFIVTPTISLLIQTVGDIVFVFLLVMSIPTMLLAWLGARAFSVVFDIGETGIHVGLVAFLICVGGAFSSLLVSRLVAEWIFALFSIARDVNILRRQSTASKESQG